MLTTTLVVRQPNEILNLIRKHHRHHHAEVCKNAPKLVVVAGPVETKLCSISGCTEPHWQVLEEIMPDGSRRVPSYWSDGTPKENGRLVVCSHFVEVD